MKYFDDICLFNQKFKQLEKLLLIGKFFKTKKIILKTLEVENEASRLLLIAILKFSHAKKEINASNEPKENLRIIENEISRDWCIENEIETIFECMELNKKHKKSPVEFLKDNNLIILDENNQIEKVNFEKLTKFKEAINSVKEIFEIRLRG